MSNNNIILFKGLKIIAWIFFIGLCIQAGGLLFSFIFSIFNPEFIKNLYENLDLSELYSQSESAFFGMYSFVLALAILKAYLFYFVIRLVNKFDLEKPFQHFISQQIIKISYYTFAIGLLGYIAKRTAISLSHKGYHIENLNSFWSDSQAFILMAAVIYIIAGVISRGIEIQQENDLTI